MCVFLVLHRYHDQLVATEAKFPIAENQVISIHYFVIIRRILVKSKLLYTDCKLSKQANC